MLKKLSLVAFSTLLIAQYGSCLPKPSSSESTPLPEESNLQNGRKRLEELADTSLLNLINFELQRSNQVAKDVLADPSMNSIDNEAMEYEKRVLRKYVKDTEEALVATSLSHRKDRRFFIHDMKSIYKVIIANFRRLKREEAEVLTPEQKVTWDALKKHGYVEYRIEVNKGMEEFACYLADEFENYMKTVSTPENEREKDMVEAWNKYTKRGLSKDQLGDELFYVVFDENAKS